jgi:ferredoxin
MDNAVSFCNYECVKCTEICPTGALVPLTVEQKKTTQIGRVFFNRALCVVTTKEKACGSCSEHCPTQAVHMVPYKNNLTIPETNADICVGCGACEHVCPVTDPHAAIYVRGNKVHQMAQKPVTKKIKLQETEEFPF